MTPYIRIDLAALAANYHFLTTKAAPAQVGCAVKANAYGLGLIPVAQTLHREGCRLFFTAYLEEALELRARIKDATIVALHGFDANDFETAVAHDIVPMLNHTQAIKAWSGFAKAQGRTLPAMIHIDTGMSRLGLSAPELDGLATAPSMLDGIEIKAWASHLACADEPDNPMSEQQRQRFQTALSHLPKAPVSLSATTGLFLGGDFVCDIVRPGIALYGDTATPSRPNPLRPVVELHASVLQIREVPAGATVGYGARHRFERPSRVATLGLGYADGYHRSLANKGTAQIGPYLAPVVGGISMDLMTVDVTDVPEDAVRIGDDAILIGPHRPLAVIAQEAGTISYELLTALGPRVRRVYREIAAET